MGLWDLTERELASTYDELARLRESLRPLSVERQPAYGPIEEIASPEERTLHITPNVEDLLGWTPAYLKAQPSDRHLVHPVDLESIYCRWYRCLMGRAMRGSEVRVAHADASGYVWIVSDMRPRLRSPDGHVRDVYVRTFDLTALRARELDFVLSCLIQFQARRDREMLDDLGIPQMIDQLLPRHRAARCGTVLRFRRVNGSERPLSRLRPRLISHSSPHPS